MAAAAPGTPQKPQPIDGQFLYHVGYSKVNTADRNKAVWLCQLENVRSYALAKYRGRGGGTKEQQTRDGAQVYVYQIRDLSLWDLPNVQESTDEAIKQHARILGKPNHALETPEADQGRAATALLGFAAYRDGFQSAKEGENGRYHREWVIPVRRWRRLMRMKDPKMIYSYYSTIFQERMGGPGAQLQNDKPMPPAGKPLPIQSGFTEGEDSEDSEDSPGAAAAKSSGGRAPARKRRRTTRTTGAGADGGDKFGKKLFLSSQTSWEMKLRF